MSDESGNAWAPPKGPFTRQGSTLLRGDGQKIAIAMAANEADWMLKQLNAAALAAMPGQDAANATPLRLCGYCQSWNPKPCGIGCCWSPKDPTIQDLVEEQARALTRDYSDDAAMLSASPAPEEK
jgi:hypothetical protein